MFPIPPQFLALGAALTLIGGFAAGWTVRDWKRDAEVLAGIKKATELVDQQRGVIDKAAQVYEQEKQDAGAQNVVRENTIREIYRDRKVPVDCAVPDAAAGVLDSAIAAANARAAGKPAPGLPAAPGPTKPDNRP